MPVSAQLDVNLSLGQTGANAYSGGPFWTGVMNLSQAFTDGVAANQVDRVYMAERTVASGANDDIDLNGVVTDALGAAISAVKLIGIMLINRKKDGAANTTNLTLGAGTNPVVGYLGGTTPTAGPIRPGGCLLLMNPDASGLAAITAGTGDILRITNSAGAANSYQIGLLLRSA